MASKEQEEGVARVFGTLAASAIISIAIGLSEHNVISARDVVLLWTAFPVLLVFSWILRSPPK